MPLPKGFVGHYTAYNTDMTQLSVINVSYCLNPILLLIINNTLNFTKNTKNKCTELMVM